MVTLELIKGECAERTFRLTRRRTVIGRHLTCHIQLPSSAVSREHAQITRKNWIYFLEDLDSNNGTYLNRVKIKGQVKLHDSDEIQLCDLVFRFHLRREPNEDSVLAKCVEGFPTEHLEDACSLGADTAKNDSSVTRYPDSEIEDAVHNPNVIATLDADSVSSTLRLDRNAEAKLRAVLEFSKTLGRALDLQEVLDKILDGLFTRPAIACAVQLAILEMSRRCHGESGVEPPGM